MNRNTRRLFELNKLFLFFKYFDYAALARLKIQPMGEFISFIDNTDITAKQNLEIKRIQQLKVNLTEICTVKHTV